MSDIQEVGDNGDLFDQIHALSNLNRRDRLEVAKAWSRKAWDNAEASTLVITLASLHHWDVLPALWHNKSIRNVLWLVVDEIARYALKDGNPKVLVKSLPNELRKVEWDLALNFVIKEHSVELLHIFLSKKAKPSFAMIERVSSLYNDKGGEFLQECLTLFIRKVPWRQCLGFRSFDDWRDLIKRGFYDDNPSLFVMASAIMSSKDKIKLLHDSQSDPRIKGIIKHFYLPKSALAKASNEIKKEYLLKEFNI